MKKSRNNIEKEQQYGNGANIKVKVGESPKDLGTGVVIIPRYHLPPETGHDLVGSKKLTNRKPFCKN